MKSSTGKSFIGHLIDSGWRHRHRDKLSRWPPSAPHQNDNNRCYPQTERNAPHVAGTEFKGGTCSLPTFWTKGHNIFWPFNILW